MILTLSFGPGTVSCETCRRTLRTCQTEAIPYVPRLSYETSTLSKGTRLRILTRLKSDCSIVFRLSGTPYGLYCYSIDSSSGGTSCAVLAPEQLPNKPVINTNDYHCPTGHSNEVLTLKTAEYREIVIEGNLLECRGYAIAKGLRKSIEQSTHTRTIIKIGRVFVDLCGPKVVKSLGRKR